MRGRREESHGAQVSDNDQSVAAAALPRTRETLFLGNGAPSAAGRELSADYV